MLYLSNCIHLFNVIRWSYITSSITLNLILLKLCTECVNYSITMYDIAFKFKLPCVDSYIWYILFKKNILTLFFIYILFSLFLTWWLSFYNNRALLSSESSCFGYISIDLEKSKFTIWTRSIFKLIETQTWFLKNYSTYIAHYYTNQITQWLEYTGRYR